MSFTPSRDLFRDQANPIYLTNNTHQVEDEDNVPLSKLRPTRSAPSSRRPSSNNKPSTIRRPSQPAIEYNRPSSLLEDSSDDDGDHIPIAKRAAYPSAAEKYKSKVLKNLQVSRLSSKHRENNDDDDDIPLVMYSRANTSFVKSIQHAFEDRRMPASPMYL
ncbi:hypothetical protein DFQ30_004490 [Apophysomyces sp. BC1015]|nr:hypothetical protein DFQ30_004490 [Apophysomyces sp. BC1015]KAG0180146.1 hypothetical protein DFQ29_001159 [Apophysomyces sp. BC1021]